MLDYAYSIFSVYSHEPYSIPREKYECLQLEHLMWDYYLIIII